MHIGFQEYRLITEGFGKLFAQEIARLFSAFKSKPTFSHDGKTISFNNLTEIDKDSIIAGLQDHFKKYKKLKIDLGNISDYRMDDDTFISIQSPKKHGNKYDLKLVVN